jgi:Protein of unknown function (DUF2637)
MSEDVLQRWLLLAVFITGQAVGFTHVHDLAASHGQGGAVAWAIAAVLETMTLSASLEMRRRHRLGQSAGGTVLVVLGASLVLSMAAQVAEAEPSPWGWTLAAVPSLGAFALAKIVLTRPAAPETSTRPRPVPASTETAAKPRTKPRTKTGTETKTGTVPVQRTVPGTETDLEAAALAVADELADSGTKVTRDRLVSGLRERGHKCGTKRAGELLEMVRTPALVPA